VSGLAERLWTDLAGGRKIEIACLVDLEKTAESFHAYTVPEGIDIGPGDIMLIHDMTNRLDFGERSAFEGRATVVQAGFFGRIWTQMSSIFELTELYEVGFQPKD